MSITTGQTQSINGHINKSCSKRNIGSTSIARIYGNHFSKVEIFTSFVIELKQFIVALCWSERWISFIESKSSFSSWKMMSNNLLHDRLRLFQLLRRHCTNIAGHDCFFGYNIALAVGST